MSNVCKLCEKTFADIRGYQYHMDNNVCTKVNTTYQCQTCDKILATLSSYLYHTKKAVCEKQNTQLILSLPSKPKIILKSDQLKSNNELHNNFNKLTFDKYQQMCEEMERLKTQPLNSTNINIDKQVVNVQINYIHKVPPAFLSMDTYETTMQRCPTAMDQAVFKHPTDCIIELIKSTNCNPNHPEFNSIMITNKREGSAKVSDGDKFILVPRQKVITQLIDNKRELIQMHINKHPEKYDSKTAKKMENYMDILEDDEQYKELENEIVYLLIGMKDIIGTDKWTAELLLYLEQNKTTHLAITQ